MPDARVAALLLLALAACVAEPAEEEDPSEHACEHAAEAGAAVTAAASRGEGATIGITEEPWAVALTPGEAGWVSFTVDEELDALLFAGTADVVSGLYAEDDAADVLAEPAPNELCPDEIPEHWDLALTAGTWHLELGPTAVSELWLTLISAEGHAHE